MDKKHNNLAQTETDLMAEETNLDREAISPGDHTGIKLNAADKKPDAK